MISSYKIIIRKGKLTPFLGWSFHHGMSVYHHSTDGRRWLIPPRTPSRRAQQFLVDASPGGLVGDHHTWLSQRQARFSTGSYKNDCDVRNLGSMEKCGAYTYIYIYEMAEKIKTTEIVLMILEFICHSDSFQDDFSVASMATWDGSGCGLHMVEDVRGTCWKIACFKVQAAITMNGTTTRICFIAMIINIYIYYIDMIWHEIEHSTSYYQKHIT